MPSTSVLDFWPKSLLGIPMAAAVFGIQVVPFVRWFVEWLQYVPGGLLYVTAIGIGYEAVSGRVALAWLAVPIAVAALSPLPHWQERGQAKWERARVAGKSQTGFGPGAGGLAITVEGADTARALARRYAVTTVYSRREFGSMDYIAFTRPAQTGDEPVPALVSKEPEGTITVSSSSYPFKHGLLEGYTPKLNATWPDGRTRALIGVGLYRISIPAYPLAGCPTRFWSGDESCRVRWARPIEQAFGYSLSADPDRQAADIARLIGLKPLTEEGGTQ
ncbi:hypothetical protein NF699_14130 [Sphingomonadaceae bacterium OTU29LAMAA1]|nr:hypothetical protein NF699_14130 [Sphingomonadaceae bacterium OTU29LAMAA1]